MTAQATPRWFLGLYAAWLFGLFAYFVPGPTWNPVSRFDLTRSIVERHTLIIDEIADDTGDKALSDGHWYSDKAPLPALVAVLPYAVMHGIDRLRGVQPEYRAVGPAIEPERRVLVNSTFRRDLYACSLVTAAAGGTAIGIMVFALLRRWTGPVAALFGSLAVTVGTPVFPYATSFYGHVPAAACVLAGYLAVTPGPDLAPPSGLRMRLGGLAFAAAIGCEYITLFPVVVLVAWTVYAAGRERAMTVCRDLLLGGLLPVAVIGLMHTASYGAPWRTGYSHIASKQFAAGHAKGLLGIQLPNLDALLGLIIGPRRGLVYVAPVTAVLAGWWITSLPQAVWSSRAAAWAALALLAANGGYYMWWGGAAVGPRHLVPAMAFLALGAPAVYEQTAARRVGFALALLSGINMLAMTAVGLEAPERANVIAWVWGKIGRGELAAIPGSSNLGIFMGLPRAGSLGPLLAWAGVGLRILWRSARRLEGVQPAEPSPESAAVRDGTVAG
jgi:hypothetical protein